VLNVESYARWGCQRFSRIALQEIEVEFNRFSRYRRCGLIRTNIHNYIADDFFKPFASQPVGMGGSRDRKCHDNWENVLHVLYPCFLFKGMTVAARLESPATIPAMLKVWAVAACLPASDTNERKIDGRAMDCLEGAITAGCLHGRDEVRGIESRILVRMVERERFPLISCDGLHS
jgi:hypothetical protein